MASTFCSSWNNFFLSAGIPESVANEYAIIFSQHRIRMDMLRDITKEILLDMGIKAMGDIIAILRQAKDLYTQNELKLVQQPKVPISQVPRHPGGEPAGTANSNSQTAVRSFGLNKPSRINPNRIATTNGYGAPETTPTKVVNTRLSVPITNKIQSRVSSASGALIASANSAAHNVSNNKRQNTTISESLAKRLRPAEVKVARTTSEKTLTVHYPSSAAIAKAKQRIAVNNNGLSTSTSRPSLTTASYRDRERHSMPQTGSIKSRLGTRTASRPNINFH